MATEDRADRVCVIGAGASGLGAAKSLREHGFAVDVYELADEVGGHWYFAHERSRLYESVHVISSKPFTQFPDFPMPDEWPDYPHHRQIFDYLRRYAEHFGLTELITFSTAVSHIAPLRGGRPVDPAETADGADAYDVTVHHRDDGAERTLRYRAVVIANGHNWSPKLPDYPGQDGFTGEIIHAADYRSADQLDGKRVLVVGAGNTGCDIAVEAAQNADSCLHSTRRGYWYISKYNMGRPSDQFSDIFYGLNIPRPALQWLFERNVRLTVGDFERHGLKEPDHRILETHPILNDLLVYYVGHGEIEPKDDIERFEGDRVVFADGTSEEVDLVIFATGYLITFPFIDHAYLNWVGDPGYPRLYRNAFHPDLDGLFVCGLIQPNSGLFKLCHWQSVIFAKYLRTLDVAPAAAAAFRERARAHLADRTTGGVEYIESTRHYVEVEHMDYIRALDEDIDLLAGAMDRERGETDAVTSEREVVLRRLDWALPAPPAKLEVLERLPDADDGRPPLLFVHGPHLGAWCWDEHWMPAAAERGWACYAVSLRGHGGSETPSHPDRVTLRHYEHDVMQTIAELPRPPVLVGHSMGGRVVQRLLARYPAPAGVLLAPTPVSGSWRYLANLVARHPVLALRGAVGDWDDVDVPPELMFAGLDEGVARRHLDRLDDESMLATLGFNLPERELPSKAPALVLGAEHDRFVDPVDLVRTARRYGTQARIVRGVGHAMMLDRDWETPLAITLGWLDETLSS